jgi:hypothetical protein
MAPRRFLERLRSRRIPALGLVLAAAGLALAVVAIATSGDGSGGGGGESSKSACATAGFAGPVRRSARATATVTDERRLSATESGAASATARDGDRVGVTATVTREEAVSREEARRRAAQGG